MAIIVNFYFIITFIYLQHSRDESNSVSFNLSSYIAGIKFNVLVFNI